MLSQKVLKGFSIKSKKIIQIKKLRTSASKIKIYYLLGKFTDYTLILLIWYTFKSRRNTEMQMTKFGSIRKNHWKVLEYWNIFHWKVLKSPVLVILYRHSIGNWLVYTKRSCENVNFWHHSNVKITTLVNICIWNA